MDKINTIALTPPSWENKDNCFYTIVNVHYEKRQKSHLKIGYI